MITIACRTLSLERAGGGPWRPTTPVGDVGAAPSRDTTANAEIDRILREEIINPVGPEFMAPPLRSDAAVLEAAE